MTVFIFWQQLLIELVVGYVVKCVFDLKCKGERSIFYYFILVCI